MQGEAAFGWSLPRREGPGQDWESPGEGGEPGRAGRSRRAASLRAPREEAREPSLSI